MKNLLITIIGGIMMTSCASIGAVIDGGKDLSTSVIDSSVKTAGNVSSAVLNDVSSATATAAQAVEGVVDTVVAEVDKQTDELQAPKKQ